MNEMEHFHNEGGRGSSMKGGQTRHSMNGMESMDWNDCDLEKKNKKRRILPNWILGSNNKITKKVIKKNHPGICSPSTEKITCATPNSDAKEKQIEKTNLKRKRKNEKVNEIKKMFEKQAEKVKTKAINSNPNCVKDEGVGVKVPPPVTSNLKCVKDEGEGVKVPPL